jgi:hypothetical protein
MLHGCAESVSQTGDGLIGYLHLFFLSAETAVADVTPARGQVTTPAIPDVVNIRPPSQVGMAGACYI